MTQTTYHLEDLMYLMQRLREPETGCPWDLKQDYQSITPSTIEEAYEVVDAIERGDLDHLKEELGDLLFQVIFYSQLADEDKRFTFHDVVHVITEKLVRRHPHVFPDGTLRSRRAPGEALDDTQIKASWENIKQNERSEKGNAGVFDDVPKALPALTRAAKLQKRAAKLGFDWPEAGPVLDKLDEELQELRDAFASGSESDIAGELGDLMFTCVNLSRHLGHDPDSLMRRANHTFESRFTHVAARMNAAKEQPPSAATLESWWEEAKRREQKSTKV